MTYAFSNDRYERMQYRRCGRSGLLLPAVSLGAWETYGGYRDDGAARDCIFRAFDLAAHGVELIVLSGYFKIVIWYIGPYKVALKLFTGWPGFDNGNRQVHGVCYK